MASKQQVESLTEELICPICLGIFNDPVSLDCGHNFCRSCITRLGKEKRNYCPQCREVLSDRTPRVNRALANLVEKAQKLNMNPKAKGRKSLCEEHDEEFKLFCETDGKVICLICATAREHQSHNIMPLKEAVEIVKNQVKSSINSLTKKKSVIEEMHQKQKLKISGVEVQRRSLESYIKSEFARMHQILEQKQQRILGELEEEARKILNKMEKNLWEIEDYLNSVAHELSTLQKQVDQEDDVICLREKDNWKRRISEDYTLSVADGGVLPVAKFDHPFLGNTALGETLDVIKRVSVTLDVETAHPELEVSEDLKGLRRNPMLKIFDNNRKRFTVWGCVLGSEGFTSGRHYWEVQVVKNLGWRLGIATESVERKKDIKLTPDSGLWTIELVDDVIHVNNLTRSRCLAGVLPRRVGVYLSYELGRVSFYDAETKFHIHTFTGNKFTEKLYPFFWTWDGNWLRICSSSKPSL
ncbi:nuclear factor 7, brain-like [Hemitrygon akajei]|uniref:nuclear factor 7, brain-like n=1 Tax=Hemitrygon akajei TaxID=2704970 RepID=UPI003BF953D8